MDGTALTMMEDPMLRELQDELAAQFPPDRISWRVGATNREKTKGLPLAYIDARDVYERLDDVCGVAGWQCTHGDAGDGRLTCSIGIRLDSEWVWKSDGAGARQASPGLSEQDANKGDFSDALKRAAVAWGVGRYLYDVNAPWVEIDDRKRIVQAEYSKLESLLRQHMDRPVGMVTRGERVLASVVITTLQTFCTSPQAVDEFIEANRGMLEKLTKGQKAEVWQAMTAIKEKAPQ